MTKTYSYKIDGTNHEGLTWTTRGQVACDFIEVFGWAMRETFEQLTNGKAQYGYPGKGCDGPYKIHRVLIEEAMQ